MATKRKKKTKKHSGKGGKSYKVEYYEGSTLKSRRFIGAAAARGFARSLQKLGKKVVGVFVFEPGQSGPSGFIAVGK